MRGAVTGPPEFKSSSEADFGGTLSQLSPDEWQLNLKDSDAADLAASGLVASLNRPNLTGVTTLGA
jgi:hypothetical protein